jgi:glucoamylase
LDEVAFPVLLAWRLWKHDALGNFAPYDMVRRAAGFLLREGPVTAQDRWEEHYEIAAGRDVGPSLRALQNFSQGIGLIPEQIWDGPDLAARHLRFGGATNAAVPLLWAYSEYVNLHRSAADGRVFDLVQPAYER